MRAADQWSLPGPNGHVRRKPGSRHQAPPRRIASASNRISGSRSLLPGGTIVRCFTGDLGVFRLAGHFSPSRQEGPTEVCRLRRRSSRSGPAASRGPGPGSGARPWDRRRGRVEQDRQSLGRGLACRFLSARQQGQPDQRVFNQHRSHVLRRIFAGLRGKLADDPAEPRFLLGVEGVHVQPIQVPEHGGPDVAQVLVGAVAVGPQRIAQLTDPGIPLLAIRTCATRRPVSPIRLRRSVP